MGRGSGSANGPDYPLTLRTASAADGAEMLEGVDRIVVDIQDVGSRYYTFVWTMAHCMESAAELGIPVTILDRPNPIGGSQVEGTVLEPAFASFVGLYPTPTRHGMTAGEIATYVQQRYLPSCELDVIAVEGWNREEYGDTSGASWAMPSPNMPTIDTATVYPGGCLLEATNLSEGRGTTRPFEIFGAPFIDGWALADRLREMDLPGVVWRPLEFEPTFNKHAHKLCEGVFLHVTDRRAFRPVASYIAAMRACVEQTGLQDASHLPRDSQFTAASAETGLAGFAWRQPPYEYVNDRMPIDTLAGNAWLKEWIGNPADSRSLADIEDRMRAECDAFTPYREAARLY